MHAEMGTERLLLRKEEFNKTYLDRTASAKNNQEAMQKDLELFNKGIDLLLQGKTYRQCKQEMPRFSTVYSWIYRNNLPMSFRESFATNTRHIDLSKLLENYMFPYFIGAYQAKTDKIPTNRLSITTNDTYLEKEIEKSLRSLRIKYTNTTIAFNERKSARIYIDSKELLSHIFILTENNTAIPKEFLVEAGALETYLTGFFDARAVPSYSASQIQDSRIIKLNPRIIITKKGHVSLLSAINTALHYLEIDSCYNPSTNPRVLSINEKNSIEKIITLKLFTNKEKIQKLKDICNYWKEKKDPIPSLSFKKQKIQLKKIL